MKRTFDFLFSFILIIIFLIPMMLVSVLILVTLGRPIVFKQERPGLRGKTFFIYKFTTMTNETDPEGNLEPNEMRMTRSGKLIRKLTVDELRQLFNDIKGDMR